MNVDVMNKAYYHNALLENLIKLPIIFFMLRM